MFDSRQAMICKMFFSALLNRWRAIQKTAANSYVIEIAKFSSERGLLSIALLRGDMGRSGRVSCSISRLTR